VKQSPLSGVSMCYSFDNANAPTRKDTQYYEMLSTRGIWHEGWKASTEHGPLLNKAMIPAIRIQVPRLAILFDTLIEQVILHLDAYQRGGQGRAQG
jgi:hypothetical protein